MNSVNDTIVREKNQYIEKFGAAIDRLNVEIGNLDSKITSTGIEAKIKLAHEKHMSALRQKRDDARDRLAEITAASDDTWEHLKDRLESIWASMRNDPEQAKAH